MCSSDLVNGTQSASSENWEEVQAVSLDTKLRKGENEFLIVAKNGGTAPNPAGLFFEAHITLADGSTLNIGTDKTWETTAARPDGKGKFKSEPTDWKPSSLVSNSSHWNARVGKQLAMQLAQAANLKLPMVRAALLKNDFLMRALGRPNRDQIVSVRPNDLSTLEAIDLANGQSLADALARGAKSIVAKKWDSPDALAKWLYQFALARPPAPGELELARATLGEKPSEASVQDLFWAVCLLPEYQLVR